MFSREELIIGKENVDKLNKAKIAIFGLGGVGSFVLEGLVRSGIENFVLIDNDVVDITNLNRQIIATTKTIGIPKVEAAKQRILEINPNAKVEIYQEFFGSESNEIFDMSFSYVIDCVDTVTAKLEIIERAKKIGVPVISCMGTGNKLSPTEFEVADIYETSVCPLAKVMRKELKNRNIDNLKVVYSKENQIKNNEKIEDRKKRIQGSISFVPSVAGMIIASEVVKDILNINK